MLLENHVKSINNNYIGEANLQTLNLHNLDTITKGITNKQVIFFVIKCEFVYRDLTEENINTWKTITVFTIFNKFNIIKYNKIKPLLIVNECLSSDQAKLILNLLLTKEVKLTKDIIDCCKLTCDFEGCTIFPDSVRLTCLSNKL